MIGNTLEIINYEHTSLINGDIIKRNEYDSEITEKREFENDFSIKIHSTLLIIIII